MSQELYGKWYVYRYSLVNPVLKAFETTLEISRQTKLGCLARFELSEWTEPAEIEMIADETGGWYSNEEGSFGFLDFRWTRVELDDENVLMGQVFDKDKPQGFRDFFVAARSRRTKRLPEQAVYEFGGAYYTPFNRSEPMEAWGQQISVHLGETGNLIQIDSITYDIDSIERNHGGLVVAAVLHPQKPDEPEHSLALWILPVAESGDLLATGFYNTHLDVESGSSEPECQGGTGTGGKPK